MDPKSNDVKKLEKSLKLDMLLMFLSIVGFIGGIVMVILAMQGYTQISMATIIFIIICTLLMISGLKQASDDVKKLAEARQLEAGELQPAQKSKYQTDKKKKKK